MDIVVELLKFKRDIERVMDIVVLVLIGFVLEKKGDVWVILLDFWFNIFIIEKFKYMIVFEIDDMFCVDESNIVLVNDCKFDCVEVEVWGDVVDILEEGW